MGKYLRKIDSLGRVVIPRELRDHIKIVDNELILIESNDQSIQISKFSVLSNYRKYVSEICETFKEYYKINIQISDNEDVIYNTGIESNSITLSENIIKDSIIIGNVKIETSNKEYICLLKFITSIISTFTKYAWF